MNPPNKVTNRAVNSVYPAPFHTFPNDNPLSDQMRMVARLIAARTALGNKRQVSMVSLGGFDLHGNLVANQPKLMQRVSEAMTAFHNAMADPGINLSDKVTAFTASDFGRTLASNGDGSDHGWGSHHLVVGGAVKGKAFYGYAPPAGVGDRKSTASEDLWQVGQGRLLPTTSVDQYAATLAKWFGVSDTDLPSVLPNSKNFNGGSVNVDGSSFSYPKTLGFV